MKEIFARFKKDETNQNGFIVVHDSSKPSNKNELVGGGINGFDNGIELHGGIAPIDGLVIQNCNAAILNLNGTAAGNLFVSNCPTLVKGSSGSRTGKIFSGSEPTTILQYVGAAGNLGATLEGFNFPKNPITTTASSNNIMNLFAVPTKFAGKLSIQNNDGANLLNYLADITYDGTNLTVTDKIKALGGAITTASLSVANGQLALTCNTSSSITLNLMLDFQGEFYQA